MRTTVDIPDAIYRRLKSRAASEGQSTKAVILRGVHEVLRTTRRKTARKVSLPIANSSPVTEALGIVVSASGRSGDARDGNNVSQALDCRRGVRRSRSLRVLRPCDSGGCPPRRPSASLRSREGGPHTAPLITRSNRSRFMTLSHAATKSPTNFSRASSHA